jgi:hypothetical protein
MERPSPTNSATLYKEGTVKKGNDGNKWAVSVASNGVKRWKKVSRRMNDGSRKVSGGRKTSVNRKSRKASGGRKTSGSRKASGGRKTSGSRKTSGGRKASGSRKEPSRIMVKFVTIKPSTYEHRWPSWTLDIKLPKSWERGPMTIKGDTPVAIRVFGNASTKDEMTEILQTHFQKLITYGHIKNFEILEW